MCKTLLQVSDIGGVYEIREIATPMILMVTTVKPGMDDGYMSGVLFHFVSQGKKSIDFVSYSAYVNADKIDGSMKLGALIDMVRTIFKPYLQGQVIRGHLTGVQFPKAVSADDITDKIKNLLADKESEVTNG